MIHRLGEIRDRSFEQQRYRASGLNLVTAAIVLWNTVYLEQATQALLGAGKLPDDGMLGYGPRFLITGRHGYWVSPCVEGEALNLTRSADWSEAMGD